MKRFKSVAIFDTKKLKNVIVFPENATDKQKECLEEKLIKIIEKILGDNDGKFFRKNKHNITWIRELIRDKSSGHLYDSCEIYCNFDTIVID